jgi:hypothetical protein
MATWLETDGSAGVASTPGSSLDIPGDADLRILARAADWSPATGQALLAKRDSSDSATAEWTWSLEAAVLGTRWRWFDSVGTNLTQVFGNSGGTDGLWLPLRMTFDVDDGSGNRLLQLYNRSFTDLDTGVADLVSDSGWSAAGGLNTTAGTTDIRTAASTILELGSQNNGGTALFIGGVAAALVVSGLTVAGGTVLASPDFTDLAPDATTYEDAQGNVWTFRSGVTIEGLEGIPPVVPRVNGRPV